MPWVEAANFNCVDRLCLVYTILNYVSKTTLLIIFKHLRNYTKTSIKNISSKWPIVPDTNAIWDYFINHLGLSCRR